MENKVDLRFWYLRDHKFFREISNKDLKSLCVISGFKKGKKGDLVFFGSEEQSMIFFLKKGVIKIVSIGKDGEEIVQEVVRKGDIFGQFPDASDDTKERNEYGIVLTNNVVLCSFTVKDFEALMMKKPELALKYTKFIGLKFKRISNNYTNLFLKSAEHRLIQFLIEWANSEGIAFQSEIHLENYLTQADLAQIICSTRQTVISLIKKLETQQLIHYSRKTIILLDVEKLKDFLS
ncbi:Crp/Fnr family transcriptional regulator [Echinicola sediminis]